jgi:hypothetical protein
VTDRCLTPCVTNDDVVVAFVEIFTRESLYVAAEIFLASAVAYSLKLSSIMSSKRPSAVLKECTLSQGRCIVKRPKLKCRHDTIAVDTVALLDSGGSCLQLFPWRT